MNSGSNPGPPETKVHSSVGGWTFVFLAYGLEGREIVNRVWPDERKIRERAERIECSAQVPERGEKESMPQKNLHTQARKY